MSDTYDSPWKKMLERYFPDFMAFFFPAAHRDIDWAQGYESQDQELLKIMRDAELGKRIADKLMKVRRIDGEEQYVFIHIEVQDDHDASFPERMYVYNYRVYDRYRCPVEPRDPGRRQREVAPRRIWLRAVGLPDRPAVSDRQASGLQ